MKVCGPVKEGACWKVNMKQGDKGHIARGRYCKIYTVSPAKMVMFMLKEHKTRECQIKLQQLQWKGKEKRKTT
jgi:hypothetical protein